MLFLRFLVFIYKKHCFQPQNTIKTKTKNNTQEVIYFFIGGEL